MNHTHMSRDRRIHCAAGIAAVVSVLALAGCSSTAVTAGRLEGSIAPTFANLYVQQQAAQGHPLPTLGGLHPQAHCVKGTPAQAQQGAGDDWVCYVSYLVAGAGTRVTATYTVNLQTNGCYAADGDGPTALNGSRTITGAGYRQVLNPLWLVNGCFDVG